MAKKSMSIEELIKEKEREIARLQAFGAAIAKLESELHWNYCSIQTDENGDNVRTDDDSDYVWVAPTPDTWNYEGYVAYKSVVDEIKALV